MQLPYFDELVYVQLPSTHYALAVSSEQTSMVDAFVKAYHDFRNSVDFNKSGVLPDLNNLIWYLLMGVPRVPADEDLSEDAPYVAIDQRVTILKAVFVEVNRHETEDFLDEGLERYDQAGKTAKSLLTENTEESR